LKYYINYSDKTFIKQQNFALKMAKLRGGFDSIVGYSREDIDKEFYEENKNILDQPRGGGYWLWKPYFIYKRLLEINEGDYLFYSDSGAFFLKSVDILINELEKYNQDIMGFELPLIEKQWTKQELFNNMNCNIEEYKNSNQIMASYILIKKTKKSLFFFKEYLEFAKNELNITDKYDKNILQDKEFIEHRHDQSIFSLLYKKYNLKSFKDATQRGEFPISYGASYMENIDNNKLYKLDNGRLYRTYSYKEKYKNVLFHNRKGDPIFSVIKFYIKRILFFFKLYKGIIK
jgi:hypothetical protein